MRFSTLSATAAIVAGVSALPQQIQPNAQPATALPVSAFLETPKFVTPLTLEEAMEKFKDAPSTNSTTMRLMAAKPATPASATCTNPRTRPEWETLGDSDKQAFVDAIKCLMKKPASGQFRGAQSRYEDVVTLHQTFTPQVHNNDIFLLWHRYLLWSFENILQTECGYSRSMPWWDEAKWAGNFQSSSVFSAKYFGGLTNGGCVTNGQFNSTSTTAHIGPGNSNRAHCISRNYNAATTQYCSYDYVNYCASLTDYHDMQNCNQGGPHAQGHNGIGGVMSDVYASPSDPVFWLHHGFVDHMYQQWQIKSSSRVSTTGVDGTDATGAALTMNTNILMTNLKPTVKLSQVVDTKSTTLCYTY